MSIVNRTPAAGGARETMLGGKTAVVVGSGPSGAIAAIHLARKGMSVHMYERSTAPDIKDMAVGPRSYEIHLTNRGVASLEAAGISLPEASFQTLTGNARYSGKKVSIAPYLAARCVNRGTLASHSISEACRQYPDNIQLHFGAKLDGLEVAERRARFALLDGSQECVEYDLLVGADGAGSSVRSFLQAQVPGFTFTQLLDQMEYKTLQLPSLSHVDPLFKQHFSVMSDPKTNSSMLAATGVDGVTRAVYIMNEGRHGSMQSEADYVQALKSSFPAFKEDQYPLMAAQLLVNPVSKGGLNTRCSQLWGPSVVLVGDAAHSMWPSLGQGANAAVESAAVLGQLLDSCQDLSTFPQEYHAARHADALAAVDLTEMGIGSKNSRTAVFLNLGLIRLIAQFLAHKLLPWLVPKPALMSIGSSDVSYSEIKRTSEAHAKVANVVLGALLAGFTALIVRVLAIAAKRVLG